jgi:hypothetical protein
MIVGAIAIIGSVAAVVRQEGRDDAPVAVDCHQPPGFTEPPPMAR